MACSAAGGSESNASAAAILGEVTDTIPCPERLRNHTVTCTVQLLNLLNRAMPQAALNPAPVGLQLKYRNRDPFMDRKAWIVVTLCVIGMAVNGWWMVKHPPATHCCATSIIFPAPGFSSQDRRDRPECICGDFHAACGCKQPRRGQRA
jgi:hypothetical protein